MCGADSLYCVSSPNTASGNEEQGCSYDLPGPNPSQFSTTIVRWSIPVPWWLLGMVVLWITMGGRVREVWSHLLGIKSPMMTGIKRDCHAWGLATPTLISETLMLPKRRESVVPQDTKRLCVDHCAQAAMRSEFSTFPRQGHRLRSQRVMHRLDTIWCVVAVGSNS